MGAEKKKVMMPNHWNRGKRRKKQQSGF